MKYVKKYESFRFNKNNSNSLNEGVLDNVLKSAKGTLKNFISGILRPFNKLKDDFKMGLKLEDVKMKINNTLDEVLKVAIANINKSIDENDINQIIDSFIKEIDEKMIEFDTEIKSIKESKVLENSSQNALIGARVILGILKDEYVKQKQNFDKKYAEAKDIESKKQVAILRLKTLIENYKKKINDENILKKSTEEYKKENNIKEIIEIDNNILKSYDVSKINDLIGKEIFYKKKGFIEGKSPTEQEDLVTSGELKSIQNNQLIIYNKNIDENITKDVKDILPKVGFIENSEQEVKDQLSKIKGDENKMKKISQLLPKILSNLDDDTKIKEIENLLDK